MPSVALALAVALFAQGCAAEAGQCAASDESGSCVTEPQEETFDDPSNSMHLLQTASRSLEEGPSEEKGDLNKLKEHEKEEVQHRRDDLDVHQARRPLPAEMSQEAADMWSAVDPTPTGGCVEEWHEKWDAEEISECWHLGQVHCKSGFHRCGNSCCHNKLDCDSQPATHRRRIKVAAEMAEQVYGENPSCPDDWYRKGHRHTVGKKTCGDDKDDWCRDTILVCGTHKEGCRSDECIVAFSGTDTDDKEEIINDINMLPKEVSIRRRRGIGETVQIHTGFYKEFEVIMGHRMTGVEEWNSPHYIMKAFNCDKVHVTGHSLGGAIADIYLLHFWDDISKVYTFGAPKPFYAVAPLDRCCRNCYRFQILFDPMPGLPPDLFAVQIHHWWHGPLKRRLLKCCTEGVPTLDHSDAKCGQDETFMFAGWGCTFDKGCGKNPHASHLYNKFIQDVY